MRFSTRTLGLVAGFALLTGLAQCENQTCFDFDENGERFEFPCTSCSENDGNPCTYASWRIEPGETCSLDQQPVVPDGEDCELEGVVGVCLSGGCEEVPTLEEKVGTITWAAMTTPPGGGQPPAIDGGCVLFVDVLSDINYQLTVTLEVRSDGANGLTTSWTYLFEQPLLGSLGAAAELGDLQLNAVVTNALGGPIESNLTPEAQGALLGAFYGTPNAGPLLLETESTNANPNALTEGSTTVIPTGGSGSTVNVNWDGQFTLQLDLQGAPLLTADQSTCDFNVVGTGVDFVVQ